MNIRILIIALLLVGNVSAHNTASLTQALHKEIANCKHQNLNEQDHPTIFKLVRALTTQAHTSMPQYISTFSANGNMVLNNGSVHRTVSTINAYFDLLGDLHICHDILTDLSYDEIQGIIAVAIAKNMLTLKVVVASCATLGSTVGLCYFLNKYLNLGLESTIADIFTSSRLTETDKQNILLCSIILPIFITCRMSSNYLQKSTDMKAATIADTNRVIDGIIGLQKVREKYIKENFFSRIAKKLNIKKVCDILFYPVRSFNDEERIAYLKKSK